MRVFCSRARTRSDAPAPSEVDNQVSGNAGTGLRQRDETQPRRKVNVPKCINFDIDSFFFFLSFFLGFETIFILVVPSWPREAEPAGAGAGAGGCGPDRRPLYTIRNTGGEKLGRCFGKAVSFRQLRSHPFHEDHVSASNSDWGQAGPVRARRPLLLRCRHLFMILLRWLVLVSPRLPCLDAHGEPINSSLAVHSAWNCQQLELEPCWSCGWSLTWSWSWSFSWSWGMWHWYLTPYADVFGQPRN